MKERTALANRIRGLLGEYGIVVAVGLATLRRQLPDISGDAGNHLTVVARQLFAGLREQLIETDKRVQMCQHISGHKVKQHIAALRSPRGTSKIPQAIQTQLV